VPAGTPVVAEFGKDRPRTMVPPSDGVLVGAVVDVLVVVVVVDEVDLVGVVGVVGVVLVVGGIVVVLVVVTGGGVTVCVVMGDAVEVWVVVVGGAVTVAVGGEVEVDELLLLLELRVHVLHDVVLHDLVLDDVAVGWTEVSVGSAPEELMGGSSASPTWYTTSTR